MIILGSIISGVGENSHQFFCIQKDTYFQFPDTINLTKKLKGFEFMSLSKYIVKLLNLKDKNISFDNNFYSEEVIKEVRSQVYYAKLTYKPKSCPCCGHVYDEKIQRHGFKT